MWSWYKSKNLSAEGINHHLLQLFRIERLDLQLTGYERIRKMKRTILVLAGTTCFTLLSACAWGQQGPKAPMDDAKPTVTQTEATAMVEQSHDNDNHRKSKKNQKKNSAKKGFAKEPTENERIFDEMLRSAAAGGL
jgi:hypothetical protein